MQEADSQPYDRGEEDYVTHVMNSLGRSRGTEPVVPSQADPDPDPEAKASVAGEGHLDRWRRR